MNKLASIYFLQSLNLQTSSPNIIQGRTRQEVQKNVDSFYYDLVSGWVLRCGEPPEKGGSIERGLPWDTAHGKQELVRKIIALQKEVGEKYFVFCHPSHWYRNEVVKGGVMVVEGKRVIVESAIGDQRELNAFYRGYRAPEQQIIFKPGMLSQKRYGGDVLNNNDLLDLRNIERILDWSELDAVSVPTCVEFSWLKDGSLYVHDLSAVN